ncbi:hypothetical protein BN2497_975 [Janthinobacterium sp. CG23_2]|nr:hypothetical protein BN2497_975 [Janthinobacterium sp. CG23_2]CUU26885.1 hypothetical protein BN3177_975 [Janthinobacterium sp. CG23_2]
MRRRAVTNPEAVKRPAGTPAGAGALTGGGAVAVGAATALKRVAPNHPAASAHTTTPAIPSIASLRRPGAGSATSLRSIFNNASLLFMPVIFSFSPSMRGPPIVARVRDRHE